MHVCQNLVKPKKHPGVLAFCQKLIIKRPQDTGKAAASFLMELCGERWLIAAMMSDAATETAHLIRQMDTENLDTTEMCHLLESFLNNISWMFFSRGVLSIPGHVSFIIKWYEERTHNFVIGNQGHSIGGQRMQKTVIDNSFDHMKAWVQLTKTCLSAEFPSFDVINCFSVFVLPHDCSQGKPRLIFNEAIHEKLSRLANIFSLGQKAVQDQFK